MYTCVLCLSMYRWSDITWIVVFSDWIQSLRILIWLTHVNQVCRQKECCCKSFRLRPAHASSLTARRMIYKPGLQEHYQHIVLPGINWRVSYLDWKQVQPAASSRSFPSGGIHTPAMQFGTTSPQPGLYLPPRSSHTHHLHEAVCASARGHVLCICVCTQ